MDHRTAEAEFYIGKLLEAAMLLKLDRSRLMRALVHLYLHPEDPANANGPPRMGMPEIKRIVDIGIAAMHTAMEADPLIQHIYNEEERNDPIDNDHEENE